MDLDDKMVKLDPSYSPYSAFRKAVARKYAKDLEKSILFGGDWIHKPVTGVVAKPSVFDRFKWRISRLWSAIGDLLFKVGSRIWGWESNEDY